MRSWQGRVARQRDALRTSSTLADHDIRHRTTLPWWAALERGPSRFYPMGRIAPGGDHEPRAHYRHHRPGWPAPGRAVARERRPGVWTAAWPAQPQATYRRARSAGRRADRGRPDRPGVPDQCAPESPTQRGVQPRRHELRGSVVEAAGAYR